MAATVWKGHLVFGLVSIPIKLHRAARAGRVSFKRLYRAASDAEPEPVWTGRDPLRQEEPEEAEPVEHVRLKQASVLPGESEVAAQENVVRGYEYQRNRFVTIDNEELRALQPPTAREMRIIEFVRMDEIDPVYLETSYYVAPDQAGQKAYALLFEALRRSGYVALAEFAMHRREHVVVIRPGGRGLLLHTLYYETEVRKDEGIAADTSLVTDRELKLAGMLVQSLAGPFEPAKFRDKYIEKVQQLIASKVAGEQGAPEAVPERPPAEVVDILSALRKSLDQTAKKPPARAGKQTPVRKLPRSRRV